MFSLKHTLVLLLFWFCANPMTSHAAKRIGDISPPDGYTRTENAAQSYQAFLRGLPLKQTKQVALWTGAFLPEDYYDSVAVLDLPLLFDADLEQCADFSMRLWADYLNSVNALDQLALYDYHGNPRPFANADKDFTAYLRWHMAYSNSYSIKAGAEKVRSLSELRAGDMFVQNNSGGIGHVSVVVDQATSLLGEHAYLVGYSYMPAQQFHIEDASNRDGLGAWFTAEGYKQYAQTVFGHFGAPEVMRFQTRR
ncbi:hypothetical protein GCM10008090_09900 [Arenicella chitinivorans]|uniref:Uncharacterized protein n=1 Tax=Arenicella chitinivorans TaxID=1329800 RepID=A0A918RKC1_9GAMM|nr:DUF4846 domain-containing protein [Arenicella chitinivorans]GHA02545.1 hypothetical protein GCM10008090_09900 [Arenicella chitinivorans]